MEKLEFLLKQSFLKLSLLALLGTSLFSPLFLFLFLFKPSLFKACELNKLIILSISLSFPAWLVNFSLVSTILARHIRKNALAVDDKPAKLAIISSMVSLVPFYLPCMARIFYPIDIHLALKAALGIEVIIIAYLLFCLTKSTK